MLKYFATNQFKFEGCDSDFNPLSDNLPWSFIPDHKVTIQEIKYALSSYYQGTRFNPHGNEEGRGKYRSIGVPNTDICGIQQIRPNVLDSLKGLEWASYGGGAFTCCFPVYTNVPKMPRYLAKTGEKVSTDNMYWTSRLIAALTDAHFSKAVIFTERYQNSVFNKSYEILNEYDNKYQQNNDEKLLLEANEKIIRMVQSESEKTLGDVLFVASNSMKTRFNRGDN